MTSALEQTGIAGVSAALGREIGDAPWMSTLRADAGAAMERMSWPDSHEQRPWKYLDVSHLSLAGYTPGMAAPERPAAAALRERFGIGETSGLLVQLNSETVLAETSADGLTLADFSDGAPAIEQHLGKNVLPATSKFTATHYALLRGGVLIEVAADAEIPEPVRIVRSYETGKQLAAPHTLIVTGANSRVTIIEDFRSSDEDIMVFPAVEVVPGPGSEVRYTTLHRWGTKTRVFVEQRVVTERDSAFIGLSVATGGQVVKANQTSSMVGRGSSSELYGLCIGNDHQHVDFSTYQDHIGPDTRSDLLYKAALKDSARSVYYGVTRVGLEAKNADANQENRNLLLSENAIADSDPVLEILTSNVIRCSHGATAGPVDEEQLYYLESRGIPRPAAEALLVSGYLAQVIDRVPDERIREELTEVLEAKMGAR
ncbi:MAG: Fe-S cluster assembly protein SufD [Dehalococcoidia bacterium]|nr:Fe-S cluster assembly protein SufD [Dehalococcoidia bacterium]